MPYGQIRRNSVEQKIKMNPFWYLRLLFLLTFVSYNLDWKDVGEFHFQKKTKHTNKSYGRIKNLNLVFPYDKYSFFQKLQAHSERVQWIYMNVFGVNK